MHEKYKYILSEKYPRYMLNIIIFTYLSTFYYIDQFECTNYRVLENQKELTLCLRLCHYR